MRIMLVLFSLAFLSLSTLSTCTTDTPNQLIQTIYDTEDKPLNKHSRYFIVSAFTGAGGGGVFRANLGNQEQNNCPTSVLQSGFDVYIGESVYFIPNDPKQDIISEMSTVNIKFYVDSPKCDHYSTWKVDNFPKPAEQYTISTGEPLIDSMNINNQFKIKAISHYIYTLVFCPGENFSCQNVGITDENGYRRLVVTENAKAFVFIRDTKPGMEIM